MNKLVCLCLLLSLPAIPQEEGSYPKAKSKIPVQVEGDAEAQCRENLKFTGDKYPRSIEARRYPRSIGFSSSCPEGGKYTYSSEVKQPGNDAGFQNYFLIRCSKHTGVGYNSVEGVVDPRDLKPFPEH